MVDSDNRPSTEPRTAVLSSSASDSSSRDKNIISIHLLLGVLELDETKFGECLYNIFSHLIHLPNQTF